MNGAIELFRTGGCVMIALGVLAMALSFLIVERFLATGACAALPGCNGGPSAFEPEAGLRRMGMIRACIVVAPLLGLLGTVTGMIETFQGIGQGQSIAEMGQGISKALLTTQYGLAIAAPGMVAERVLERRIEKHHFDGKGRVARNGKGRG